MYPVAGKKVALFCYLLRVTGYLSFVAFLAAPVFVLALTPAEKEAYQKAIVPCGTFDEKNNKTGAAGPDGMVDNPCGFTDVIKITRNIIMGWIMVGVTLAVVGFAYAGYLYITAMGSAEKIKHAHSIFYKTVLGFAFMLGAWLIAYTFERTFLTQAARQRSFLQPTCGPGESVVDGRCK